MCKSLREVAQKALKLRQAASDEKPTAAQQASFRAVASEGSLLLLQLKRLNRAVYMSISEREAEVVAAKAVLNSNHLQLQNLEYEKGYLRGEISSCLSVRTPQTDMIPLVAEAQFQKDAPPQYKVRAGGGGLGSGAGS